jgi:hypothetical protein
MEDVQMNAQHGWGTLYTTSSPHLMLLALFMMLRCANHVKYAWPPPAGGVSRHPNGNCIDHASDLLLHVHVVSK